nr:GGDEF domain-containing protein [Nakamurella flavida]
MIADATVHRIQWCGAVLTSASVVTRGASDVPDAVLSLVLLTGGLAAAGLLVRHTALRAHSRFAGLHRAALTDGLTDVLNRRGLTTAFPALLARAQRHEDSVGVLVIDIDHFKQLNDRHGHDHGDRVLQEVCRIITGAAGDGDLVGRIGGEEMVVVTVGPAATVAKRIRARLADSAHPDVTVSIGFVDVDARGLTPATWWTLVADADRGLYDAKRAGRDTLRRGRPGVTRAPQRPAAPMIRPRVGRSPGPLTPAHPALLGVPFALINLALLGLCLVHRIVPGPLGTAALIGVAITGALVGTAMAALRAPLTRELLVAGATVTVAEALLVAATAVDEVTRLFALSPLLLGVLVLGLALSPPVARLVTVGLAVAAAAVVLVAEPAASATVLVLTVSMVVAGELLHLVRRDHESAVLTLQATAVTDPLTALANRRGLDQAFARARPGDTVTVVALDVDDFKAINDRLGHVGGDAALVDLARVLGSLTDARTVVGRSGGDEFVVMSTADPAVVLDRVHGVTRALPAGMTVSIGVNHTVIGRVDAPRDLWPLVARADVGLLAAKRDRRRSGTARRGSTATG